MSMRCSVRPSEVIPEMSPVAMRRLECAPALWLVGCVSFNQRGGLGKVHQLFGAELPTVIEALNKELAA